MIRLVAIGGTTKPGSSTERALGVAVAAARAAGAEVEVFACTELVALPHYGTDAAMQSEIGARLVQAARSADGVLIASPGYHGGVSALVKNAIDYLEDLARDDRPYLDGRTVGLIATAYGHQAAVSTLSALRTIAHALRGWPTPLGLPSAQRPICSTRRASAGTMPCVVSSSWSHVRS
ncbi:NADPH-dependent FMN reductase [Hankyongella ginsenosidimutans]|uniref:NADPH-dependent FMN reductase n=1 Tax=Hankyongella ginsenosidimutans TaxID=1763828 RepID=UPI00319E4D82